MIRRWLYLPGGREAGLYCITDTLIGSLGIAGAPLMVCELVSGSSSPVSSPAWGYCVVFLSARGNKPFDGLASHPEWEGGIFLVASC